MTYRYKGQSVLDDKKSVDLVKKYAEKGLDDVKMSKVIGFSRSQIKRIRHRHNIKSGHDIHLEKTRKKREKYQSDKSIADKILNLAMQEYQDLYISCELDIHVNDVRRLRKSFKIKSGEYYRMSRYENERDQMIPHVKRLALEEKNDFEVAEHLDKIMTFKVTQSRVASVRQECGIKSGAVIKRERITSTIIDVWNKTKSDVEVAKAVNMTKLRARARINEMIDNGTIEGDRLGVAKKSEKVYNSEVKQYKGPQYFEEKRLKNMPGWIADFIRAERLNHGVVV